MQGVLVIDKPSGLSSAATVDKVKRALRADRAGHGGTLDPLATGVLPVCLGGATKLAPYLLADDKAYEAEGLLGVEMDTLDRTGQVVRTCDAAGVTREQLAAAIASRIGEQLQVPPMYSAIKQDGVRLYKRARAGEDVERAPRAIRIDELELIAFEPPRFRIRIACSKGTYVRSIVADLGTDVGCGAHLAELRRTRSGRFSIVQAVTLADVEAGVDLATRIVAMGAVLELPVVVVADELWPTIRNGVKLPIERLTQDSIDRFQIHDGSGRLLAIVHVEGGRVIYDRVFPPPDPMASAG